MDLGLFPFISFGHHESQSQSSQDGLPHRKPPSPFSCHRAMKCVGAWPRWVPATWPTVSTVLFFSGSEAWPRLREFLFGGAPGLTGA